MSGVYFYTEFICLPRCLKTEQVVKATANCLDRMKGSTV